MFCKKCGGEEYVAPGVARGEDGVFRWIYEMSLWSNPTILITLSKVMLISCFVLAAIAFFIYFSNSGFLEALSTAVMIGGGMAGIMLALSLISYAVYALLMGGKYIVLFEMDETGPACHLPAGRLVPQPGLRSAGRF